MTNDDELTPNELMGSAFDYLDGRGNVQCFEALFGALTRESGLGATEGLQAVVRVLEATAGGKPAYLMLVDVEAKTILTVGKEESVEGPLPADWNAPDPPVQH